MKLQELKLAFCLLSREIQGLDEGERSAPAAGTSPAVSNGKPGCAAEKTKPPPHLTGTIPPPETTEGSSQQPHASGDAKNPGKRADTIIAVSCHEDQDNLREERSPSRAHKGAARNEKSRKAAEAAAAEAKEALKHLRVELDAQKKSRIAAER